MRAGAFYYTRGLLQEERIQIRNTHTISSPGCYALRVLDTNGPKLKWKNGEKKKRTKRESTRGVNPDVKTHFSHLRDTAL